MSSHRSCTTVRFAMAAIFAWSSLHVAAAADGLSQSFPPQPLADALDTFARQSGLQLVYSAELSRGIQSPGARAGQSAADTLRELLRDTGLVFEFVNERTVTVTPASGADTARSAAGSGPISLAHREPVDAQVAESSKAQSLRLAQVEGTPPDADSSVDDELQEIVIQGFGLGFTRSITATKTDTPLIETPRSISVVTSQQMSDLKINGINEALRYVPGVLAEPRGTDSTKSEVYMRGFRSEDSEYRDGMKGHGRGFFTIAKTTIDPYGMERVEVVRGPAGVLYGQGQVGGLVNTVTKRPTETFFAEAELDVASFEQYAGKVDVGGPLNDAGNLLFRLTGLARDGEAQVDFLDESNLYVAPALTWRSGEATSITFLAHYQKGDLNPIMFVPASGTLFANPNGKIPSKTYLGEPGFDRFDNRFTSAGYLLDHHVSGRVVLRHNVRYDDFDMKEEAVFADWGFYLGDGRTLGRSSFTAVESGYYLTTDNNVQVKLLGPASEHTLLFGADYKKASVDLARGSGTAPDINPFNPVYGAPVTPPPAFLDRIDDADQLGIYVQDQSKLNDRWVITLGGRQDWASYEIEDRLSSGRSDIDDSAFTGQAGLVYLFDGGFAPYVSFAESFEPQSGTDASGRAFEPTTGSQYEIGFKYQPEGSDSLLTLSGFSIERRNVLTTDPGDILYRVQTGEQRSRGIEVEARSNVSSSLNVAFAYTYLDAEVTESNDPDLGMPLQVPKHSASLWAGYTPQGGLSGLSIGGGLRYVGATPGDWVNAFESPSFTLVDLAVRYDWDRYRVALNANNLLDKDYMSLCYWIDGCIWGARRVVTASLRYSW
jgi:iron complex outermembrane receptor protein